MIKDLGRIFISAIVCGVGTFAGAKLAENLYENGTVDNIKTKVKNLCSDKSNKQGV